MTENGLSRSNPTQMTNGKNGIDFPVLVGTLISFIAFLMIWKLSKYKVMHIYSIHISPFRLIHICLIFTPAIVFVFAKYPRTLFFRRRNIDYILLSTSLYFPICVSENTVNVHRNTNVLGPNPKQQLWVHTCDLIVIKYCANMFWMTSRDMDRLMAHRYTNKTVCHKDNSSFITQFCCNDD